MGFHQRLAQHHYVPYRINLSRAELEGAARTFLDFLALPEEELRLLYFPSPHPRDSADGYTDKRGIAGKDPKRYFHWNPRIADLGPYRAAMRFPVAEQFFARAADIHSVAEQAAARLFEDHFPQNVVDRVVRDGRIANATLRFLAYDRTAGRFAARAHYDKCPGALALYESSPGLRIGCCNEHPLTEVVHQDGTCVFMPGQLLYEYMGGAITPAWHDVIHHEDVPPIRGTCARVSIVLFVNDKDGCFPSYEKVHTPLH